MVPNKKGNKLTSVRFVATTNEYVIAHLKLQSEQLGILAFVIDRKSKLSLVIGKLYSVPTALRVELHASHMADIFVVVRNQFKSYFVTDSPHL